MEVLHLTIRHTLLLILLSLSGCANFKPISFWVEGGRGAILDPLSITQARWKSMEARLGSASHPALDSAWIAYNQGKQQELLGRDTAVDEYYCAAKQARRVVATIDFRYPNHQDTFEAAQLLYHESLRRFLHLAHEHQRVQRGVGIKVCVDQVPILLPLITHDFSWLPTDFTDWRVVGMYASRDVTTNKTTEGVGVPLVIIRERCHAALNTSCAFMRDQTTFPATAMLSADGTTLDFYNPLKTSQLELDGFKQPLASDLTADIAYHLQFHEDSRLEGFFRPNKNSQDGELFFMEPYQAEKIPIVLVHGLLSSPAAWSDIYNELRSDPNIRKRYQFWAFRYSTGAPFVKSAHELREKLNQAMACYSGIDQEQNLERTILIGHSMGGLVSKVLISESRDKVWNAIANVPLEAIAANEATKQQLASRLFFSPHPMVSRVVYIATPHQGSEMAGRLLGRIASASVKQNDNSYEELLRKNRGAFKEAVSGGLPTSIELLDPDQPFLDVLACLPRSRCVITNTILGDSCRTLKLEQSDGVVNVKSAQQKSSESEKRIQATHNGLLRHKETFAELKRILKQHDSSPAKPQPDRAIEFLPRFSEY
jgi:pimeloyl-ACP methyl ester carboxylesterase